MLTRRRVLTVLAAATAAPTASSAWASTARPLTRAHAHNDYEHARPLLDALDHRFTSVEADIYLVGDDLFVAHDPWDIRPDRTLRSLYLDPLRARVEANHGAVYTGYRKPVQLLVDIKTDGVAAYAELDRQLREYGEIFTRYDGGKVRPAAVTAVVSGDRAARTPMEAQRDRYAFYDGRVDDLGTTSADFAPLISGSWTSAFSWTGEGPMPAEERSLLHATVAEAHGHGQRVRFWATPDAPGPAREALWSELLAAGVDHLNTDDLAGLEAFLDARR